MEKRRETWRVDRSREGEAEGKRCIEGEGSASKVGRNGMDMKMTPNSSSEFLIVVVVEVSHCLQKKKSVEVAWHCS